MGYHVVVLVVGMNESELVVVHHGRIEGADGATWLARLLFGCRGEETRAIDTYR